MEANPLHPTYESTCGPPINGSTVSGGKLITPECCELTCDNLPLSNWGCIVGGVGSVSSARALGVGRGLERLRYVYLAFALWHTQVKFTIHLLGIVNVVHAHVYVAYGR